MTKKMNYILFGLIIIAIGAVIGGYFIHKGRTILGQEGTKKVLENQESTKKKSKNLLNRISQTYMIA